MLNLKDKKARDIALVNLYRLKRDNKSLDTFISAYGDLCYKELNCLKNKLIDEDDIKSLVHLAVLRTVESWDPSSCAFSTRLYYLVLKLRREVHDNRSSKTYGENKNNIYNTYYIDDLKAKDHIYNIPDCNRYSNTEKLATDRILLDDVLKVSDKRSLDICLAFDSGETGESIARRYNISRSRVYEIRNNYRLKLDKLGVTI